MPENPRIVITRPIPGDPAARIRNAGFDNIWLNDRDEPLARDQLLEAVIGAHAVLDTPADTRVDAEFFDAAGDQLMIVSNLAVGVDNIDLDEAAKRGVMVGHTPHAVTEPTADIAWLLMLGAARRAHEGEQLVRSGEWTGLSPNQLLGMRLIEKTLLIIGPGRIGYATARRAVGWKMNILYHARSQHIEFEIPPLNATQVNLDEGLARADVVSLHVPLTQDTHHLINAERLAMMKDEAILVNTARGAIVDEAALVDALKSGLIGAAGLDVYENEPTLHPELPGLDNVFLLPHLGSATVEDRQWMGRIAAGNIIAALRGEQPPHLYQK